VVKTIAVGKTPDAVSSDRTDVWAVNHSDNTVTEIDASTAVVVKTILVGTNPLGVSSDGTHVWVTNSNDGTVTELDSSTGSVVQTITVGNTPQGVSSDGTHVWVTNSEGDTVTELDASTGAVVQTIHVGDYPNGISSDGTDVWAANQVSSTVSEISIEATPPTITKFSPTSGPVGTVVTIKGKGLSGASKVTFNGVKGTVTKDTATLIKVKVPKGAKTGKIEVITPDGKVKTATAFTVT
jgi:YVTN family beta-propeller protein